MTPPIALAPTFYWLPSWRLCQWQCPHDFWPSSEYDWVKESAQADLFVGREQVLAGTSAPTAATNISTVVSALFRDA